MAVTDAWRPGATLDSLHEAARLRRGIRQWMDLQQVLEVLTPALSTAAATDPHVLSLRTTNGRYLHTSPEFPMKRLLCAYPQTDIYQIAPVFRAEESGRYHNTQFTLLEWYRVGMDHQALMDDLVDLLQHLWQLFDKPWPGIEPRRYGVEVKRVLGVWPEEADCHMIAAFFAAHGRSYPEAIGDDQDAALALFMDEFVLPDFPPAAFTLLVDFPASQSALSRLGADVDGRAVAQRFELYAGQVELANAFHELSDADTQRERFMADLFRRDALGVERVPPDERLLQALAAGLPDCAGIALGLERLHMVLGGYSHIREVLGFDDERS